MLLVAYYGGKKATIASSNKSYWKALFLTILFFTVEEGFRWVRDIDWCSYYWTYGGDCLKTITAKMSPNISYC